MARLLSVVVLCLSICCILGQPVHVLPPWVKLPISGTKYVPEVAKFLVSQFPGGELVSIVWARGAYWYPFVPYERYLFYMVEYDMRYPPSTLTYRCRGVVYYGFIPPYMQLAGPTAPTGCWQN